MHPELTAASHAALSARPYQPRAQRTYALIAGLGLLAMAVLAPIANFGILQPLMAQGVSAAAARNLLASMGLLRLGITLLLIVAVLDVVVAWALYLLLAPVHPGLSLLAAWFRVIYAALFVSALTPLLTLLPLTTVEQAAELGERAFNAFMATWNMSLVIFGLHLLILGYLVFKTSYLPKLLGGLVVVAGLGYLIDNIGQLVWANFALTLSTFTFLGEVLLIFWLLWQGIKGFDSASAR